MSINIWKANIIEAGERLINLFKNDVINQQQAQAQAEAIKEYLLREKELINDIWEVELKGLERALINDDYLRDLKASYHLKDSDYLIVKLISKLELAKLI